MVKFCAGEGGEGSGRRGEVVELNWNGGERWENVWREKLVEKVVGDVGKWWSWTGMEERGGKTYGGKNW
nr:hypothetical protein [Tanacetum cinerariifolium]